MTSATGILGLDIETFSLADISDGAPAYAEHPSTGVHCVCGAWSRAGHIRDRWRWVPGASLPHGVVDHVRDGGMVCAHNAGFESAILRYVLRAQGWPTVPHDQWIDTAAIAVLFGLPASLEGLGRALGAPVQKDVEAAKVMKRLMVGDVRRPPRVEQADLGVLLDYCARDVDAMLAALHRLPSVPPEEVLVMAEDRRINWRGLPIDQGIVATMVSMMERRLRDIDAEAAAVSDFELLSVARSADPVKDALADLGLPLASLDKEALVELLARPDLPAGVRRLLELRAEGSSRTSLQKLVRIPAMVNTDGRLRQALRYAAAHTGRWASGGIQVHNLPRTRKAPGYDADALASAIAAQDYDAALQASPNLLRGLSWQLRSVIAAGPGHEIIGGDYSAIEARVVAWLAGQSDVLQLFETGDAEVRATGKRTTDIYMADARNAGSEDRQLGKVQRLGFGYGMSALRAVEAAAAAGVTITTAQAFAAVKAWREHNSCIVQLWRDLEDAAHAAIAAPNRLFRVGEHLRVYFNKRALLVGLPSGRSLHYWKPSTVHTTRKMLVAREDGTVVEKEAQLRELRFWTPAKNRKDMVPEGSYGGKLTENVTQAVARDLLAAALLRFRDTCYNVALHVHDSIAAEVRKGAGSVLEFAEVMAALPSWARGLPMFVDAYRGHRFKG